MITERSNRVRIVNHQYRPVRAAHLHKIRQRGDGPVHGEQTIGNHHRVRSRTLLKSRSYGRHVAVSHYPDRRATRFG